jgi:hypothetical protein
MGNYPIPTKPFCIPPDFDLLNFNDFTPAFAFGLPRPFLCPLTVGGFALGKNGPPPIDFVSIFSELHGTGNVPVWFVSWPEPVREGSRSLLYSYVSSQRRWREFPRCSGESAPQRLSVVLSGLSLVITGRLTHGH